VLPAAGTRASGGVPCPCVGTFDGVRVYVLMYFDDLVLAGVLYKVVYMSRKALMEDFSVREMGEPTYFLGMRMWYNRKDGLLSLAQRQYVTSILEWFGLAESNPVRLPMRAIDVMPREESLMGPPMAIMNGRRWPRCCSWRPARGPKLSSP